MPRTPNKEWTREMYMQLDRGIKLKASPGEIAVKLGCKKNDIVYRKGLLKKHTSILTWSIEELEVLQRCKTLEDYIREHVRLFGKHHDTNVLIAWWGKRDEYLTAWIKEKEFEDDKRLAQHSIIIPRKIITEPIKENAARKTFVDEGEQLVLLNHKMAEFLTLMKEEVLPLMRLMEEHRLSKKVLP